METTHSSTGKGGKQMKMPKWIKNIFTYQCPRCLIGRVSHSHSEPHGWTTIEVYECNHCHTQYV